ncbi:LysR family transcriptional regulator [Nocardia sp. NPDC051570]|uniref:LysR family transcriptional regulator n=1 Tax=Nocardia sp. NPDC051570 TaxID=3364324 RepID=UPI0037B79FC0
MPLSPRVPDLAALDLLLSVIELGSLGRAAQAHGISQPSASSRIRYLEKLVGVPVLERTTLGSRPTAAGALIAEWARAVIDAAARLDAGIETLRTQRDSHLSVAASQTVAEYLFPKWLMALRNRLPDTAIALEAGNSAEVLRAVREGRATIGFVEIPDAPDELDGEVVAHDHLVVVVAPTHRWATRASITPAELARTPLICREPSSGTRIAFEQAMIRRLPDWRPEVLLELSSTTAIKSAVAEGVGPAVLSSLAVRTELIEGVLMSPTLTDLDLSRPLRAIWPHGQRPAGPARDLLAVAQKTTVPDGARRDSATS